MRSNYECGKKILTSSTLSDRDIAALFPERVKDCHKGSFGTLLIVGGSKNYVGAPQLAYFGAAALKMGSGVVRLGIPSSLYDVVKHKVLDATLFIMPEKKGYLKLNKKTAKQAISNATAVVAGMGIGNSKSGFALLKWLIKNVQVPLLLDADALNMLSKNIQLLKLRKGKTILTPHIKEMSRLTKLEPQYVKENKEQVAKSFAKQHSVVVLLKDTVSVITEGDTLIYNQKGTPAMATGGSGDLLSGIIGGLLARGVVPLMASAAGAYIAGQSAVDAEKDNNEYSLLPSETANYIEKYITKILNMHNL